MTLITIKETAKILLMTERAIRLAAQENRLEHRYVKGTGRGGKQIRIILESLPQEAQDRYNHVKHECAPVMQYTGKQREEADYKAWVVVQFHQSGLSVKEFVAKYNNENPPEDAISISQLYRWQKKYSNGQVADLIDKRGGHNRGECSIPEEAWEYFYALYMTQQKRSIKLCYDKTKLEYPDIPSVSTFERQVRKIPYLALLYHREGPHAYADQLPSMDRCKRTIQSNEVWFSDHHLVDTFVKSADGTRAVRPWLTVFYDARSNKVMGFVVRDASPNAAVVKKCFRISVEKYGIPVEVYFDNGKDYRSKDFSRDYPMSLVSRLEIGVIYAHPYHGAAKTVERFFLTFTNRFSRLFPTYTGKDAKNRPECMQTKDANIVRQAPTMEEYINALSSYMEEYNATPSKGKDLDGKCPDQVYYENLKTKHVVSDHEALRLLCGISEERVVSKNGIRVKNNNYRNDLLLEHIGERVIVTFDPDNIDQAAVFDMENRAICMVQAQIRTPFRNTSDEDYQRAKKSIKKANAIVKKAEPTRKLNIHEIIAKNQLMEKQFTESDDTKVIEHIAPQVSRNSAKLKETSQPISARRIREEDSVSAALMKAYQKKAQGG